MSPAITFVSWIASKWQTLLTMAKQPGKILTLMWGMLLTTGMTFAQMYPGDANNNGIVNGVDVLYIGVGYNASGDSRPGATTIFEPQNLPDPLWSDDFPDGVNYAYADCDGNGTIEQADADVVWTNFGLTHGIPGSDDPSMQGTPGIDPELRLQGNQFLASGGEQVSVHISLGTNLLPANFYGASFVIILDSTLIDLGQNFEFQFPQNPWYDGMNDPVLEYLKIDEEAGKIYVAISRTEQEAIQGFGRLGKLSFVIIEDVVDAISIDTSFQVDSIVFVDQQLSTLPYVSGNFEITSNREVKTGPPLLIMPNPAEGPFEVQTEGWQIENITVWNAIGQAMNTQIDLHGETATVSPDKWPPGIYLLEVETKGGKAISRIAIR